MAILFGRAIPVIRRQPGAYVAGVWTAPIEPATVFLTLNIQPVGMSDFERLQALPEGRRGNAMMKAMGNLDANLQVAGDNHPGDIVFYDNARWLVIGESRWDTLGDADTSHITYLMAQEIEKGVGEAGA